MVRASDFLNAGLLSTHCVALGLLGPIFQLNMAGQSAVVLNSYQVASEILDKRSAIYSDRPRMIMTSEILCGNHFFPFLRYGSM